MIKIKANWNGRDIAWLEHKLDGLGLTNITIENRGEGEEE